MENEFNYRDIENKIQNNKLKLTELKTIAKQLKLKITKLKKDEIINLILDTLYNPTRYFNELYNDKAKKLTEKKMKEQNSWIHKFTKYDIKDNYSLVIIKNSQELCLKTNFQYNIGMIMNEDISKLTSKHPGFYLSTIKYIKTAEDVKLIKTLCDEKELSYKEVNNR